MSRSNPGPCFIGIKGKKRACFWILALPLIICGTLGKLQRFSSLGYLICKMGAAATAPQGCCEDPRWCLAHNRPLVNNRWGFSGGSVVKNLSTSAGDVGSTPGQEDPPGEGNGYPLQYSCLGNPMDRAAWRATSHGVAKSQTEQKMTTVMMYEMAAPLCP